MHINIKLYAFLWMLSAGAYGALGDDALLVTGCHGQSGSGVTTCGTSLHPCKTIEVGSGIHVKRCCVQCGLAMMDGDRELVLANGQYKGIGNRGLVLDNALGDAIINGQGIATVVDCENQDRFLEVTTTTGTIQVGNMFVRHCLKPPYDEGGMIYIHSGGVAHFSNMEFLGAYEFGPFIYGGPFRVDGVNSKGYATNMALETPCNLTRGCFAYLSDQGFLEVDGLELDGMWPERSGGIVHAIGHSKLVLKNANIRNTQTWLGGAISLFDSSLTIEDSVFENCVAYKGGAIFSQRTEAPIDPYSDYLQIIIRETTFKDNTASYETWMIHETAEPKYPRGGALWLYGDEDHTYMENVNFTGNAAQSGGAFYKYAPGNPPLWGTPLPNITCRNCLFMDNIAVTDHGGAIVAVSGGLYFYDSKFADNIAGNNGGSFFVVASAVIRLYNTEVVGSSSAFGGMVVATSQSIVAVEDGSWVHGTSASVSGGVFYCDACKIIVKDSVVSKNNANFGGMMYLDDRNGIVYGEFDHAKIIENIGYISGGAFYDSDGIYNHSVTATSTGFCFNYCPANGAYNYFGGHSTGSAVCPTCVVNGAAICCEDTVSLGDIVMEIPGYEQFGGFCRCPTGEGHATPTTHCADCDQGEEAIVTTFTRTGGLYACHDCFSAHSAPSTGTEQCPACPAGQSTDYVIGATGCVNCDDGWTSVSGSECAPCGAGTTITGGQAPPCDLCGKGTYAPVDGSTSCEDCNAGYYNNQTGQAQCTPCHPGTYGVATGAQDNSVCMACDPGVYSGYGWTTCSGCALGDYLAPTGQCEPCPAGRYGGGNVSECIECPDGQENLGDVFVPNCQPCASGKYRESGMGYCEPCPGGTFNAGTGASKCTDCAVGTYANKTGAFGCTVCPAGRASTTFEGAWMVEQACTLCGKGEFKANTGVGACQLCWTNTYSNIFGASSCAPCPESSESDPGASTCTACACTKCCSHHGLCSQGKCMCTSPWTGDDCGVNGDAIVNDELVDDKGNGGAVAGGIIGGLAFVGLLVGVYVMMERRKRPNYYNEGRTLGSMSHSSMYMTTSSTMGMGQTISIPGGDSEESFGDASILGDLSLKEIIGAGAFGKVWYSEVGTTKQAVAVKIFSTAGKESVQARKDFIAECRTMSTLEHPNVIKFLAATTTPLSLVLEYAPNGTLAGAIHPEEKQRMPPWSIRLKWAKEICQGMMYLHAQGIVHRDLKPSNMLLSDDRIIKISDFGLSRSLDATVEQTMNMAGSPVYMAPEMFVKQYGRKSDIYSFGVILWEMYTGLKPRAGLSLAQIYTEVVVKKNPLEMPDYMNSSLAVLIADCLRHHMHSRPTFSEVVVRLDMCKGHGMDGHRQGGERKPEEETETGSGDGVGLKEAASMSYQGGSMFSSMSLTGTMGSFLGDTSSYQGVDGDQGTVGQATFVKLLMEQSDKATSHLRAYHEENMGDFNYNPEDIVFGDEGGYQRVAAGSLYMLIDHLTNASMYDEEFERAFFQTYRSFCKEDQLLDHLLSRFSEVPPSHLGDEEIKTWMEKHRDVQHRVVGALAAWISNHVYDFGDAMMSRVDVFVAEEMPQARMLPDARALKQTMVSAVKKYAAELERRQYLEWLKELRDQQKQLLRMIDDSHRKEEEALFAASSSSIMGVPGGGMAGGVGGMAGPAPAVLRPKSSRSQFALVLEWPAVELARQLTLIDFDLYRRIQPKECLNQAWSKKDKHVTAPHLLGMIDRFNQESRYIASVIALADDVKDRAKLIQKFIEIASACAEYQNYNSVMSILGGLGNAAVARLGKTWAKVPRESLKILQHMRTLMEIRGSYKNLRRALANARPPVIPFIGMFLTDLTFVEDGNKDWIKREGGKRLINVKKRMMLSRVISQLVNFQSAPYSFAVVAELRKYLLQAEPNVDDDEQYDQSLAREPRA